VRGLIPDEVVERLADGNELWGLDPAALGTSLAAVARDLVTTPQRLFPAVADLALRQSAVGVRTLSAMLGAPVDGDGDIDATDRRFADRAWRENPALRALLDSYLATASWARGLVEDAEVSAPVRSKARFALDGLLDALAPSNVALLNPVVVREAVDTGGLSLARGAANLLDDLRHNRGRPRQVDASGFELGRNLAATPGRVVFANELIELIAYTPQTERVHAQPLLCSPPWINKYYVMDLAPQRSFIEHAVRSGLSVFTISYRDPDESLAELTMDDYLRLGLLTALDEVAAITGAKRVNLFALCLGGTLAVLTLAHLAQRGELDRIGWTAITNTLVDFSIPGDLGIFTDEKTIARLEARMRRRGYLEAHQLSRTFDWLRGNDLVWSYVVSNWYMGRRPPAFDILAWNGDSTRLPAAMHSQYLRACYLENSLVRPGSFSIAGTPVDLGMVTTPLYVLGAETDHITPWRGSFLTTQHVGGPARFTLTSSGHIAGIVNPPQNVKAAYWTTGKDTPKGTTADDWLGAAERVAGSWWGDWTAWATARSGELGSPPRLPDGPPAPGDYVRGRATSQAPTASHVGASTAGGAARRRPAARATRRPRATRRAP